MNAKRLKDAIDVSGMSQRDLAFSVGTSEMAISRYVHGVREPRAATLAKMAKVLGTTVEFLTGMDAVIPEGEVFWTVREQVKQYGGKWTKEQKKELINMIVDWF